MNIPTSDEIRAAYKQGEEAIIQLFERLIQELQAQQDRLNKNSVREKQAAKKAAGRRGMKVTLWNQ
jgi:uncharacterized protein YllA (UPF0747 family)